MQEARRRGGKNRKTPSSSGEVPEVEVSLKGAGILLVYGIRELLLHENSAQKVKLIFEAVDRLVRVAEAGGPKDPFAVAWQQYKQSGDLPEDAKLREAVEFHENTLRMMREATQPKRDAA
jgi:hypothetical protein